MVLLHGWAIFVGAAAIGLPVLIHWLTRPRPVRLPLSTLRFVREVVQQKRARHRLRDIIVLCLRVLAVGLLAWAFARPLLGPRPLIAPGAGGDAVRVVILDQSQSMGALANGIAMMERARPVAARYLDHQMGLKANLILAAARARGVFDSPSANFAALRDELGQSRPQPQRLDAQAAINLVAEMLTRAGEEGEDRRRELVIVSDFQRSNWANVDFSPLPKETLIQLEAVAPAKAPANLGILRVGVQGRVEQGRPARLEVDIGNYSQAAQVAQVEMTVGDASYRLEGLCPPAVKTTLSTEVTIVAAGWQIGEARLTGVEDALAADNARALALDVRPVPTYAMLTRESARPRASSSHYLERALAPLRAVEGSPKRDRVVRVDPLNLDRDAISSADLVVLDHPGMLSAQQINLLAGLLRRGRAVLYVAAEGTDASNLKLLADAAGSDLRMPVEFAPPASGQVRRGLFWAEVRREQPPFAVFGDGLPALLGELRFAGGLVSRSSTAVAGALADDVWATYSDRTAALVVTPCGAGMLAVLNADLGMSDLPVSPMFVPLLEELAGHLLAQRRAEGGIACGETAALYLPSEAAPAAGLQLSGPAGVAGGGDELGDLVEEGGFVLWRWQAVGGPGTYRVQRGKQTIFAVAAGVPPQESDLQVLDGTLLRERLAQGRQVAFHSAAGSGSSGSDDERQKDAAWAWVLAACAACILLEWATLKAFRT